MNMIIEKAKEYCLKIIADHEDIYNLVSHLPEAEKWAIKLLKRFPEADPEIVLLSVWLHDVSHYVGDLESDHAIRSEKMASEFLQQNGYPKDKMGQVLHCVRAHRCRDVQPETLEAKLMACIDSASHMTDYCYINIVQNGRFDYAYGKMDRDYRDVGLFPEIQKELAPIHNAWGKLIREYEKLGVVKNRTNHSYKA